MQPPPPFQLIREQRRDWGELQACAEQFFKLEEEYLSALYDKADTDRVWLIKSAVRDGLKRVLGSYHVPVLILGSNSAGKSTFVNALLGCPLMPAGSGHVSARICRIAYAEDVASAYVSFAQLTTEHGLKPDESIPRISLAGYNPKDLGKVIGDLTTRASAPANTTPEEYRRWARTIVEVHYPFPLLEPGIDLYDGPGFSQTDDQLIQEQLQDFLLHVQPVPLFLYRNPTFSDSECRAFLKLRLTWSSGLDALGVSRCPFFLNTFCDIHVMKEHRTNQGKLVNTDEDLAQMVADESNDRLRLLQASKAALFVEIKEARSAKDCIAFACISARDILTKRKGSGILLDDFIEKFARFCCLTDKHRLTASCRTLDNGCSRFFESMRELQIDVDAQATQLESEQNIGHFETHFRHALADTVSNMQSTMKKAVDDLKIRAGPEAAKIRLAAYEGQLNPVQLREAAGAFKEQFFAIVEDEVFNSGVSQLRDGIANAISWGQPALTLQPSARRAIILGLNELDTILRDIMRPMLSMQKVIRSIIFDSISTPLTWLISSTPQSFDNSLKKSAALDLLDQLSVALNSSAKLSEIRTELEQRIQVTIIASLRSDLHERQSLYSRLRQAAGMLARTDFTSRFKDTQVRLLALQGAIRGVKVGVLANSRTLFSGRGITVMQAEIAYSGATIPIVVSTCSADDKAATALLQQEMHRAYTWSLTPATQKFALPYLASVAPTATSAQWSVMYTLPCGVTPLDEFLDPVSGHKPLAKDKKLTLQLAIAVCAAVEAFNQPPFCAGHMSLRRKNVFVHALSASPTVLLSRFGACETIEEPDHLALHSLLMSIFPLCDDLSNKKLKTALAPALRKAKLKKSLKIAKQQENPREIVENVFGHSL